MIVDLFIVGFIFDVLFLGQTQGDLHRAYCVGDGVYWTLLAIGSYIILPFRFLHGFAPFFCRGLILMCGHIYAFDLIYRLILIIIIVEIYV